MMLGFPVKPLATLLDKNFCVAEPLPDRLEFLSAMPAAALMRAASLDFGHSPN